jgi:hypothetical protein
MWKQLLFTYENDLDQNFNVYHYATIRKESQYEVQNINKKLTHKNAY